MPDPLTTAAISAISYKALIGTGVTLGATSMIITNSQSIGSWVWRVIHRCGTFRVVFGATCSKPEEHNLMKYVSVEATKKRVRFMQNYSYKTSANDPIKSIDIPTKGFLIENAGRFKTHIYVLPLISSNATVVGFEFWSYSWFGKGSGVKYIRMKNHIRNIMIPNAQTLYPAQTQIVNKKQSNLKHRLRDQEIELALAN